MKQIMQEKRWCLWRKEVDDKGRMTKVPYQPNGKRAQSDNPRTWNTHEVVSREFQNGEYDGIGLFFSGNLCGIDIDGSHDDGMSRNPLEKAVLDLFPGTYAELSPSGTGDHILFRVDPNRIPHTDQNELDPAYYQKNRSNGLEFYAGGITKRYFTFTGDIISAGDQITDQTDAVLTFLDKYMRRPIQQRKTSAKQAPTVQPGEIDIPRRLQLARSAANGMEFQKLYDQGDLTNYGNDHSSADLALCSKLAFWLNNDPELIDQAFRDSKLMRDKWDERRGAETYGDLTIRKAIDSNTNVYQESQRPTAAQDFATSPALKYRPAGRDLTDAGNAELFARMNHDRLRYCAALGWLTWTGKQWEVDDQAATRAALDFSKDMLNEAVQFYTAAISSGNENPVAKEYFRHAMKFRSTAAQLNMLTLAKARLVIHAQELDADPEILNTVAGIVDLRTGAISAHDPNIFCTKMAPEVPSNDGAGMWNNFLDLVTRGDRDLKDYLQRVAGMTIVGKVYEEGIQFTTGSGRNGKTTFYSALSKVLGDYAGTIEPDVLIAQKHENRFELAPLRGKRLIVSSEMEKGQRLSIKALKRLASRGRITIERKFKDKEDVEPTHHIVIDTNDLPIVGEAHDFGTWRRLTVIPFNATMPEGDKDIKSYDDILVKNAGGAILKWMIDGAVKYLAAGGSLGKLPAAVLEATKQYREHEDWLQPFIDECCVFDGQGRAQAIELYSEYQSFAARRGDRYIRKGTEFHDAINKAFRERGLVQKKPGNKVTWYGVRVVHAYTRTSAEQDFDPLS